MKSSAKEKNRRKTPESREFDSNTYWLYGKHSVYQALGNPHRNIRSIAMTSSAEKDLQVYCDGLTGQMAKLLSHRLAGIEKSVCESSHELCHLIKLSREHSIQGIAVRVERLLQPDIHLAIDGDRDLIILDKVTDPHNIGAILRSAAAFNIGAVISTFDGAPAESGAMAKAAAGAMESMPYVQVTNIVRTICMIQRAGYLVVGLDAHSDRELSGLMLQYKCDKRPTKWCFVLGNEESGIRRLVRQKCDIMAAIAMEDSAIESLNVSNTAAIIAYTSYSVKKQRIK